MKTQVCYDPNNPSRAVTEEQSVGACGLMLAAKRPVAPPTSSEGVQNKRSKAGNDAATSTSITSLIESEPASDSPARQLLPSIYLLRVEESFPALHVALPAAAAVGLRLRSGVVPAVWSRWHVSRTTSDAQGSITRAARAMPWQHAFSAGRRSHDSAELWTSEADLTMAHDVWVRVITLTLTRSHCIARPSHAVATLITAPSSLLPTDRIESGTFCGTG